MNLLTRLIDGDHQQGWAHFEWRKKSKWYQISHMLPAVEVALLGDTTLELNFGLPSEVKDPTVHCAERGIPLHSSWSVADGTGKLPATEMQSLVDWIDQYFVKVHGAPSDYHVNGYLDGI